MRFGVLGPLAVTTSDARPVRIPEVKVRALLASLVVDAGRVVPAGRLIENLWGESRPANPTGALQTRVSQLRAALEAAEPGARRLVASRPPGYLLDVAPDAVDLHRFEALLRRANSTTAPQERVTTLGDALALWRGPVLADFADDAFAAPVAARLAELRLTAIEQRAEARLELGEHGLLADELGDLVGRHPLRERLRAAHLRALYQAGRQSEALAGYRELRARLVEELGVEPGPELAALQQAILQQDPALGSPSAAAPSPPPSTLPHPLDELIGRTAEVGEVRMRLRTDRLVTLTGPGGVGKTRLATAAAWQLLEEFPDGVWLVELGGLPAQVGTGELAELVANTLGLRDEAAADLVGRLATALRDSRLLVVLDNCEHLAGPVAELTAALLRAAAGVRVLATSQRPLGVPGEQLVAVAPLPGPDAVALFVARAAARVPGFRLTAENTEVVAGICRRLDGIPLALELAAARVRALGVHELAARLDDRFRLLRSGHSGAPARQRTLRAMIDWSWELLSEAERTVLRRLAVHPDDWSLPAAEAVCGDEGLDVLDLLAALVDRSLVTVTAGDHADGPRYRLLESVAAYSAGKLRDAGELAELQRRHRSFYADLVATADPHLRGPEQRKWLCRLDTEAANLRAALDHAAADGAALPMANSLAWYWVLRGRLGEGRRAWGTALAGGGAPDDVVTAEIWRAAFTLRMGDVSDRAEPDPRAPRPADLDRLAGRARAEWFLGLASTGVDDLSIGEELVTGALEVFEAIGDRWGTAAALSTRARQALLRGDLAAVHRHGERGAALFTELGDRWGQLYATLGLGTHAEVVGDYDRAARLHREGLRMAEELGLTTDVVDRLASLGRIALLTGDIAQADELHERARSAAAVQRYTIGEEFAELGLALSARRQGRLDEAEARLRRWLEWDRRLGSDTALALILAELGFVAELRGDADAARRLHREGLAAARRSADPRAIALALEGLAGAESLDGQHALAAQLLGTATALRESTSAPLPPAERGDVDRITARASTALGADTFTVEFERGRARSDDARHPGPATDAPGVLEPAP